MSSRAGAEINRGGSMKGNMKYEIGETPRRGHEISLVIAKCSEIP
jgi:hypothetical protein